MSLLAIWVDRNQAKLFRFTSDGIIQKNYLSESIEHHTHAKDHIEKLKLESVFFKDFTKDMRDAEQILILGPGMAKHHYETYLSEQHPGLARKVIGCETVDHPTDAQVTALARKVFLKEPLTVSSRK